MTPICISINTHLIRFFLLIIEARNGFIFVDIVSLFDMIMH